MTLKLIKNEADHQRALARLDELMGAEPGPLEFDELEVLSVLIERYEDEHFPIGIASCGTDDGGEMDGLGPRVRDFLPPPERLALREDTVEVTLTLSRRSVEFFKREAARRRVPYQRMIRALVDEYAEQHA